MMARTQPCLRRTTVSACAAAVVLLLVAAASQGQLVVKQGPPEEPEPEKSYRSPMILEFPFQALLDVRALRADQKGRANVPKLSRQVCDGVRFQSLSITVTPPNRRGEMVVDLVYSLLVDSGVDKLTTLVFEVVVAEQPVAKLLVPNLDTEEEKLLPGMAKMKVPADKVPPGSEPTMRVTMIVKDND